MSGRVVAPPNSRSPHFAKFLLALGLFAGGGLAGLAQPTGSDKRDDRSPLPPGESKGETKRSLAALKFQIPNKDRMIFRGRTDPKTLQQDGGIVDLTPVAKETENKDEYDAWHEVIFLAAQFSSTELEEHAGRDATRDDLVGQPRLTYRLELLRFDGKLTKVRWLAATKSLQEAGIKEVYEALVVPLDEPPTEPISIVFTELPDALAEIKKKPEADWMAVDSWASAAGYFFKVKLDAPKAEPVPVLIGKSVRLLKEPPAGPDPKNPAALDKDLRAFKFIRDNAPIAKGDENWEEVVAWNRVLLHANRFPAEELEKDARTDVTFYDLFKDTRRDYKLDLVKFEGRLIQLKKMEPSKKLRDAGIEAAYEGWMVPKDEPSGNPICIVFTEPIEGVNPGGRVNKWVSFAGYSFKLLQYESGEKDKDDPSKLKWKKAPLLIGRGAIARPDPEGASPVSWKSFATVATGVVAILIGTALGLGWWFRRGDKNAKRAISANRARNPFGESAS